MDWADGVELGRMGCWAERTAEPNWAGLRAGLGRAGLDWAKLGSWAQAGPSCVRPGCSRATPV
ncbi:hypothetical protein CDL15_Pgr024691 [Punica granatum]|uniref:Uncharacterized protein n=1 Tax=Punica granatum TaxID=22663 RepID=A0A218W4Q0_PUNGR|nr:hypothetical protein CDL15_Pgr024691 [Punica granatum]